VTAQRPKKKKTNEGGGKAKKHPRGKEEIMRGFREGRGWGGSVKNRKKGNRFIYYGGCWGLKRKAQTPV